MPLEGYVCPPGGEEPGRKNPIDYCLRDCAQPCVTPPLLAAMWKAEQTNYHKADYISASMLAGNNCPRQTVKERFEPYWDQPTKRYWPFRGNLAHRMCEDAEGVIEPYGWILELKMQTTLEYDLPAPVFELKANEHGDLVQVFTGRYDPKEALKVTVNGTTDAYNPFKRILADQKSMADKKAEMVVKGEKGGTFSPQLDDAHVWQFNIYRWLLARTRITDEQRERMASFGLPPIKGRTWPAPTQLIMQGLSMMHLVRSGADHAWTERGRGVSIYPVDSIPVLGLKDIEEYVRPRALQWYKWLVLREPTPVVPASQKWLCAGCAFNGERLAHGTCFPTAERAARKAQHEQP